MFLIFLIFPIVEIYLLFLASKSYGFFNVLALLVFTAWLGFRIIRFRGLAGFSQFQAGVSQGAQLQQQALNGLFLFLAGVLFIVPGFISDAMGLLLLVPWTRKLILIFLAGWVESKIKQGSFKVYTAGNMGAGFGGFGSVKGESPFMNGEPQIRDVTPPSSANQSQVRELPKSKN